MNFAVSERNIGMIELSVRCTEFLNKIFHTVCEKLKIISTGLLIKDLTFIKESIKYNHIITKGGSKCRFALLPMPPTKNELARVRFFFFYFFLFLNSIFVRQSDIKNLSNFLKRIEYISLFGMPIVNSLSLSFK